MILIVCTDDDDLIQMAQQQAQNNPGVFGNAYRAFADVVPALGAAENLFVVAHGVQEGDDNNPVIGDGDEAHYWNAVEFFEAIQGLFPGNYSGSVYISACESADHNADTFSFAEVFKAQLQGARAQAGEVYGHHGEIAGNIPVPGDASWALAEA